MSFGADEEILQDFLVEAGEILEQLSEQLVELESRPDDADLLNAIFRGFHTVKGGAGFLQLHELVECCHIAENVFDILRKGERRVTAELMDVVLQALDSVNEMFSQVRERAEPTPASPELLAATFTLTKCSRNRRASPEKQHGRGAHATTRASLVLFQPAPTPHRPREQHRHARSRPATARAARHTPLPSTSPGGRTSSRRCGWELRSHSSSSAPRRARS